MHKIVVKSKQKYKLICLRFRTLDSFNHFRLQLAWHLIQQSPMSCPSRCQLPHQVKRMHLPVVACNSHLIRFQAIVRIQSDTFERSWKSVLRALCCCCVHRYTLIRRISHGSTACVKSVSSVSWKMTMMNVWAKRCGKSASHVVWKGVKCAFIYFKKAGSFSTRQTSSALLPWLVFTHKNCITRFLILSPSSSSCYWMETSVKLHPFLLRWRRRHLARNESAFHVHIFLSQLFSFVWMNLSRFVGEKGFMTK